MLSSRFTHIKPSKRALHRINVWHILQLFIQRYSRRGLFGLLDTKPRIFVAEILIHLGEDEGEDATLARVLFIVATVHEDVLLARVTMKVTEHDKAPLLMYLLHQSFCMKNSRMKDFVRCLPSSV